MRYHCNIRILFILRIFLGERCLLNCGTPASSIKILNKNKTIIYNSFFCLWPVLVCEYFEELFLNLTLWKFNLPNYQSINSCHTEFLNPSHSYVWTFVLVKNLPPDITEYKNTTNMVQRNRRAGRLGSNMFSPEEKKITSR